MSKLKKMMIVTGLSGSGKTTCLALLEDIGFFCVDNIPPKLLKNILPLFEQSEVEKIALGIDARWKQQFEDIVDDLDDFIQKEKTYSLSILFLESSVDIIMKRYNLTRRKHPLAEEGSVEEAISKEKKILSPLRERADYILDTSKFNTHDLRKMLVNTLKDSPEIQDRKTEVNVYSFGFKYGVPLNADYIIDTRFLPNPYWNPELSKFNGLDENVQAFLEQFHVVHDYLTACTNLLLMAVSRYNEEGRSNVNVYIGCTGGKHRSVYLALKIHEFLLDNGFQSQLIHRERGNW
ncbi:MAG TPA: RNase adapter RapZ [Thermotogota bacterium]|nr:RNase adapter RapZ [Thermotogota bacterium]HRW33880.1 RNase adapter RapZ [Thermotogota bacterium]